MTKPLKLLLVGLVVAAALVTTNVSMGTPSAEAQSPYCAVNPTVCTPAFCAVYPQLCNNIITAPIYPINPCGIYGCLAPYNTCAPIPYSAIYGYRPGCYGNYVLPIFNNYVCNYGYPCNAPYIGGAPAKINLAVSPAIATCGSTPVTVQANVTDGFGVPVANGTGVNFTSSIGSIGSATTIGGNATATLTVPATASPGVASITVTSGGASASSTVQVNCAPPAPVRQVIVVAQGPSSQPAPGTIIYQVPQTRPAPQQPVIIQRGPAPMPPFAPPRTGEAGLIDAILGDADDAAANQALVDSWREAEYGVLDQSQYDSVVIADDSSASVQLAADLNDAAYGVIDASQVDVIVIADDSAATTSMVIDVLSNPTDYGHA